MLGRISLYLGGAGNITVENEGLPFVR